ncbi:MAG: N-acetylmuramoyl-L-alanine amidase [Beggiatoa sp. IS2]|nr:MAG: N-acetylmuramoyl-L-alanine amidase [Beggiatoa sp. IS2]
MNSLVLDTEKAWLLGITKRQSPHCDARPVNTEIDLIVIHGISLPPGKFGGPHIDALFMGTLDKKAHPSFVSIAHLHVSAHLLIRRTGVMIQYVSLQQRAWHAGVSTFQGRERCNDFSIGIELEGTDNAPYTDKQYSQLASVIQGLRQTWPVFTKERVVGHCDVAPGRKTDPGPAFNWQRLRRLLS